MGEQFGIATTTVLKQDSEVAYFVFHLVVVCDFIWQKDIVVIAYHEFCQACS